MPEPRCSGDSGGDPLEALEPQAATRRSSARSLWVAWGLVALWVVVILGLGGAGFGAAQTSRYLLPLLHWLFPDLSLASYYALAIWLRKAAHLTEYALLGALAFRALWLSLTPRNPLARAALLAVGIAASVALTDELRQSTLQNRTGSPWDVALDVSGALGAIALVLWWKRVQSGAVVAGPA